MVQIKVSPIDFDMSCEIQPVLLRSVAPTSLKSSIGSLIKASPMDSDSNIVSEDRLQGKSLENVHTSFIKPATATPSEKEWLSLSTLDYFWVPYYTPILCTFNLGSTDGVVQHLRDSLADALVLFYPLAGRVVNTKGGPPRIHCNDAGAVFTEASVDVELVELRVDDFMPQPLLSGLRDAGLVDYPLLPQTETGLPALIIQVTHFKCGGITLAANWAHAVADGRSGFHFMKSWSELARGLPVSLLPDHRRELVKPRASPVTTNSFHTSAVLSPDAQIMLSVQNSGEVTKTEVRKQPKITPKVIEFWEDAIAKLKQLGLDHDPTLQLSRAVCLSTHLWRTLARAQNYQPGSAAAVKLWILVEGRRKLSLPPGYFGNVIYLLGVIATVNELLNCSFGSTASLVHSAVASVTAKQLQDLADFMVKFLHPGKKDLSVLDDPRFPGIVSMGISHLIHFPFYELDFGFGVPMHSIRNTMGTRDGLFFVVPSSHGPNCMVVMANMDHDIMHNFLSMVHDIPELQGPQLMLGQSTP